MPGLPARPSKLTVVGIGDPFICLGHRARMLGYALKAHGYDADYVVVEVKYTVSRKKSVMLMTFAELRNVTPCWAYAIRRPTAKDRLAPPACSLVDDLLVAAA